MNKNRLASTGSKLWALLATEKFLFFLNNHPTGKASYNGKFPYEGFVISVPKIPTIYIENSKLYFFSDEPLIFWNMNNETNSLEFFNAFDDGQKVEFYNEVKFVDELKKPDLNKAFRVFVSEKQVRESFLNERFGPAIDFAMSIREERVNFLKPNLKMTKTA